jgi:quercetin dioxygenase-like cupin family protein
VVSVLWEGIVGGGPGRGGFVSYEGDGDVSAVYRPEGAVDALQIRSTNARFIAPGSLTSGRFGLFRWDMAAGAGGADPHFHRTFSESFFILSGSVRLYDGRRWTDGAPGDFLHVPEGGVHGFRNDADEPASMLILFAPGAPRERYFEELSEIYASDRQLTEAQWTELYARHDQYMV